MALPVIQANSMTGSKRLSLTNGNDEDFEALAVEVVDDEVKRILSDAAYIDIRDNVKTKWTDLLDGVDWIDASDKQHVHKGLTDVLRCFSFFQYTSNPIYHNSVGFTVHDGANSTAAQTSQIYVKSSSVYNSGISSLCDVYDFLQFYSSITTAITGFVDNGAGSYTIQTSSTKYLDNADTVTINGIDYIISNLVTDVSFDITAALSLTFSGDFTYKPFEDLNLPNLDIIT